MDPVGHCVLNHFSIVAVFRSKFQGPKKKNPYRHASLVNNAFLCFTIYKWKSKLQLSVSYRNHLKIGQRKGSQLYQQKTESNIDMGLQ